MVFDVSSAISQPLSCRDAFWQASQVQEGGVEGQFSKSSIKPMG